MVTTEQKLSRWVGFTEDLLRRHDVELPGATIRDQFWETFDAEPSWNRVEADGRISFAMMHPVDGWPTPEWQEHWRTQRLKQHPLHLWFTTTGCSAPQSRERVPSTIAGPAEHESVREEMGPLGFEQQLAIPYHLTVDELHMFMLVRPHRDFSDDDMDLARRVQPLVWLVDRQVEVLSAMARRTANDLLTGREAAVLGLLSDGFTAAAIGRRLGCSPRTVHKHLEHLYRKLDVRDRLMAVRVGVERGLLPTPEVPRPRRQGGPVVSEGG
jgi:DNA-binding CsgD family transcriptional regulator